MVTLAEHPKAACNHLTGVLILSRSIPSPGHRPLFLPPDLRDGLASLNLVTTSLVPGGVSLRFTAKLRPFFGGWGLPAECGSSQARDGTRTTAVTQAAAATMLDPQATAAPENSSTAC